ncbi:MAG: hypothetical protein ACFFDT_33340 [Candidatus Hodarchaeota archaeon]
MEREELEKILKDKNSEKVVKVLRFCKDGKQYKEIMDSKKGVGLRSQEAFKIILKLKEVKALDFADGKYTSAKEAIELAEKQ